MTTYDTRGDSGTQPTPHYCTSRFVGDDTAPGCPQWPACLASPAEPSTLGQDLSTLAGWAAGAVLFLVVVAPLLPLFV